MQEKIKIFLKKYTHLSISGVWPGHCSNGDNGGGRPVREVVGGGGEICGKN